MRPSFYPPTLVSMVAGVPTAYAFGAWLPEGYAFPTATGAFFVTALLILTLLISVWLVSRNGARSEGGARHRNSCNLLTGLLALLQVAAVLAGHRGVLGDVVALPVALAVQALVLIGACIAMNRYWGRGAR